MNIESLWFFLFGVLQFVVCAGSGGVCGEQGVCGERGACAGVGCVRGVWGVRGVNGVQLFKEVEG